MSDTTTKVAVEGSRYKCESCEFEVLVVEGCPCKNGEPALFCCDEKMKHLPKHDT